MRALRISWESWVLMAVCCADMLSTAYFVSHGMAVEQNPLMAVFFNYGLWAFIAAKMISFMPFVVLVEMYRKRNPDFASKACKTAISAYVLVFVVCTFAVNR